MSDPFLGEVRVFGGNYPPSGWAFCGGQLLPITQNEALFSLLGTTYGGDGQSTFALPDLRGRCAPHPGTGLSQGQVGGTETVTLQTSQLPAHPHPARCATAGSAANPRNAYWASEGSGNTAPYAAANDGTALAPAAVLPAGGSQPHENMQPFLALNFIIALEGVYPSRD